MGGIRRRRLGLREAAEMPLDRCRDRLGADVAGDHDHGPLGRVPVAIEGPELLARRGADHALEADRLALRIERAGQQEVEHRLGRATGRRVAEALLAQDDAALGLDLVGGQRQPASDLAQDADALVDQCCVVARQVQLVHGLVEAGPRIGVRTKGQARALQERHELTRRQVLRALEGHVLEEMGEAALRLGFHERAGLDQEAQADTVRRSALRQDGVAHAVGQPAPGNGGIMGEHTVRRGRPRWQRLARRERCGGQRQPDADQQAAGSWPRHAFLILRGAPPVGRLDGVISHGAPAAARVGR